MNENALPRCSAYARGLLSFGGRLVLGLGISLALWSCGDNDTGEESLSSSPADDVVASPAAAQTIRIERMAKVGDRYHLRGEGQLRQVTEVSMDGQLRPDKGTSEEFATKLDAEVEVLAVGQNGRPSRVSLRVNRLTRADHGGDSRTLLEDAVVDAESEAGGITYSIAGVAVEEEIQEAIKLFALLQRDKVKADEDAIFGTPESRVPGAQWPVNEAAIVEFFTASAGMDIVPGSIHGTTKFEKVGDVGGVSCQLISGKVSMDVSAFPGVPANATLSDSTLVFQLDGAYPVDPSLPVVEKTMSTKMAPTLATSSNGITTEIKLIVERQVTSRRSEQE